MTNIFHKNEKNINQDRTVPIKANKKEKRMPIWGLIVTDSLLTAVFLCVFALYHHVLPRNIHSEALVVATNIDSKDTFSLPENAKEATPFPTETENKINQSGEQSEAINYGNTNTMAITSDLSGSRISLSEKTYTEVNLYHSDNIEFITNMVELGSGNDMLTYYVSDVYVTNIQYLKTAFATGAYGKNLRDQTAAMAEENDALLAISGDFYGNGETGLVIRNGILYRDVMNDADVCVLFTDGSMKTYSPEVINTQEVIEQGAWQAWTFGPALLDGEGNILSSFNTTTYLNSTNPRCAIGYVEPGHYIFMVVDGRNPGYSRGVTLSELATLMSEAGCKTAYNLDGGKSAAMVNEGEYVNIPCEGGRSISDIIYIAE